jgi:hypothetical protein
LETAPAHLPESEPLNALPSTQTPVSSAIWKDGHESALPEMLITWLDNSELPVNTEVVSLISRQQIRDDGRDTGSNFFFPSPSTT